MDVHTLPRGPAKVLLVMCGAMLFTLAMADIAYGAYSIAWTEELQVRNESDFVVTLTIGETNGRIDVPPHATAVMTSRGWNGRLVISSGSSRRECGWVATREHQPLIIDDAGAHCDDIRPK